MTEAELIRDLRRRARERVSLPARCILLMAALGIGIGIAILLAASGLLWPQMEADRVWCVIAAFGIVWGLPLAYGAWEMDRLGNFRAAQFATWMALVPVPVPLYLVWVIGAFFGLVALNDPAVRAAFATGNRGALDDYLHRRRKDDERKERERQRRRERRERANRADRAAPADDVPMGIPVDDEVPVVQPAAPRAEDPNPFTDLDRQLGRRGRPKPTERYDDAARQAVGIASLVLLVCCALNGLTSAVAALFVAAVAREPGAPPGDQRLNLAMLLTVAGLSAVSAYGAWQMYLLRSREWGFTAAILFVLAALWCCVLLPVSVWVLVVLNRADVKELFARDGARPHPQGAGRR